MCTFKRVEQVELTHAPGSVQQTNEKINNYKKNLYSKVLYMYHVNGFKEESVINIT